MGTPTKAYIVEKRGAPFVLQDVVLDEVGPDEVLVEMKFTGLCHTDLVVQNGGMPIGAYPAVLGHEGLGTVRQLGAAVKNPSLKAGDTVFLSFRSCLQCAECQSGACGACVHVTEYNFIRSRLDKTQKSPISLPDGTPVHGQFFGQSSLSRLAIVSERCVVKCATELENLAPLAPLGCGYLTGAGAVMNVCRPKPTSTMAILGMGAVGIAALLTAKALDVQKIVAVDNPFDRYKTNPDLITGVHEYLPLGVDYILDTTGVPSLLQASLGSLAHGGTLALVGVPPVDLNLQVNALDLLTGCKKIIGIIEGYADPQQIIPLLVQWYKDGKFPVDKLARVYPAGRLDEALEDLHSGKVIKPVLSWDDL